MTSRVFSDRQEYDDTGKLDELVFHRSDIHMERMHSGSFFLSITDSIGINHRYWFEAKNSKLNLTLAEIDCPTPAPSGSASINPPQKGK